MNGARRLISASLREDGLPPKPNFATHVQPQQHYVAHVAQVFRGIL
jgi:hypothetical protein